VPEEIVEAIACIYTNSCSRVKTGGELSDEFPVSTGVLQGDTLAPFLFIVVLDYCLRKVPPLHGFTVSEQPHTILHDLDFADDIALLDNNVDNARDHLNAVMTQTGQIGLHVNIDKTKVMAIPTLNKNISLPNNTQVQEVNDFKYLGSMMSSSATDLKARRGQAFATFWSMKKLWRAKDIPIALKVRIFHATCLSIFLYGSEAWTLNKGMEALINSFATICYRFMLGKKWSDKIKNESILQLTGQPPLVNTVRQRQLRWLGHQLRTDSTHISRQYLMYTPSHGNTASAREGDHDYYIISISKT